MIEIYILPIAIVPGIGSAAGGVKVHASNLHNHLIFSPILHAIGHELIEDVL